METKKSKAAHVDDGLGGINRTHLALLLGLFVVLLGLVVGIIVVRQRQNISPEATAGQTCPAGAMVECTWSGNEPGVVYHAIIKDSGGDIVEEDQDAESPFIYSSPIQGETYTCEVIASNGCRGESEVICTSSTETPPSTVTTTMTPTATPTVTLTPTATPTGPTKTPTATPRSTTGTPTPTVRSSIGTSSLGLLSPTIKPTDIIVVLGTNTPTPKGYIQVSTSTPTATKTITATTTVTETTLSQSLSPTISGATSAVTSLPKSGIDDATIIFFVIGFLIVALGLAIGV